MILIDSNALVVLIVGLVDPRIIHTHKRTSIYDEDDFHALRSTIEEVERLTILPNVWTEVDNLLNNFAGNHKYKYILEVAELVKASVEKYIPSIHATQNEHFAYLGLTDCLLLEFSKECKMLISGDSGLSDIARAYGVCVFDLVEYRNSKL